MHGLYQLQIRDSFIDGFAEDVDAPVQVRRSASADSFLNRQPDQELPFNTFPCFSKGTVKCCLGAGCDPCPFMRKGKQCRHGRACERCHLHAAPNNRCQKRRNLPSKQLDKEMEATPSDATSSTSASTPKSSSSLEPGKEFPLKTLKTTFSWFSRGTMECSLGLGCDPCPFMRKGKQCRHGEACMRCHRHAAPNNRSQKRRNLPSKQLNKEMEATPSDATSSTSAPGSPRSLSSKVSSSLWELDSLC